MEEIIKYFIEKQYTIATCESLTGGLLAKTITDVRGSSKIYLGGIVAYSEYAKIHIVKLDEELVKKYGTVDKEIAKEMALKTKYIFNSDISISTTGIAGPDPIENKPVGLVYVGIVFKDNFYVFEQLFKGSRDIIRNSVVKFSLQKLYNILEGG